MTALDTNISSSWFDNIYVRDCFEVFRELEEASVDLVVADGPYAVTGHNWDRVSSIQDHNLSLIRESSRVLKPGGALYIFGKPQCIDFIDYRPYLQLNSKIIWYQPSRLAQGRTSFTNNYDIIAYFTRGKVRNFNLDDIRVPQLVELAHRKRCENVPSVKGGKWVKTKFNEKGKNPGDVWGDIKQLTYKSKELISREMLNTIQKPEKLIERIIKANSRPGSVVFDPFVGTGTVPLVAKRLGRFVFGCEINRRYALMAAERLAANGFDFDVRSQDSGLSEINTAQQISI